MRLFDLPRWFVNGAIVAALGFTAAGCGVASEAEAGSAASPNERWSIVATTGMIGDIVQNVAGDRAEVTVLMGPGVDPHLYRPTRGDMNRMLNADVVFYNGLNLEGRMTDTFVRVARAGRPVYAVTERIDDGYLLDAEDYEGAADPHVWMDVAGWKKATEVVVDALAEFDSPHAEQYRSRGEAYLKELRELDAFVRKAVATIPEDRRILVTAHDAFQYFGRAYDIEVRAIQGLSTESEAGLRRIEELVNLLVDRKISAVFTETSVPDKGVRALIDGARARGHEVTIGGELYSDAMGEPGKSTGTYVGMIRHNVTTIVNALGGSIPN